MITCVGAAHVDEVVRLENTLQPGASNPARWTQSIGGVAANASLAAAHHVDTILIAAVADDAVGVQLQSYFKSQLPSQPADALHTLRGGKTGRYCAVLDQGGELVIGLAETDIAEALTFETISTVLNDHSRLSDILVVDTNLSHECLRALCAERPTPLLAALTVSPVKAMRLADHAESIDLLITNRREASALTGLPVKTELKRLSTVLADTGFSEHVLTDGGNDIIVCTQQSLHTIPVTMDTTISGVNGAGDALAGATLAGVATGLSLNEAVATLGTVAAQRIISGETAAAKLTSIDS